MLESPPVPAEVRKDLERAIHILKEGGCKEIYLFGSAARGELKAESDLDFAVTGCPSGKFFYIFGQLMWELRRPVDLVDLDSAVDFAAYLREHGELVRLG